MTVKEIVKDVESFVKEKSDELYATHGLVISNIECLQLIYNDFGTCGNVTYLGTEAKVKLHVPQDNN